jgi:hypothetical protein
MKNKGTGVMPIIMCIVCLQFSCSEDILEPSFPDGDGTNVTEAVDYLVFHNPQERNGSLPDAVSSGKIQLNIKDTLYLMEDDPYMARVAMLHDPILPIIGFNVAIRGLDNNYYYYVPNDGLDAADSVAVIYIGIHPEKFDQPIVVIKIQPVDDTNTPIATVEIPVKPENPSRSSTPALTDPHPGTNDGGGIWKWVYTHYYEYQSDIIRQLLSPKQNLPESTGPLYFPGCCVDGQSVRVGEYMGAFGICNDTSALYRRIPYVPSYSHIDFEILMLHPTTFNQYTSSYVFNFYPAESDMCTEQPAYLHSTVVYTRHGTHNYSKGATSINFTITFNDPQFGPTMPWGNIKYTQNILAFTTNIEGMLARRVYQRFDGTLNVDEIENEVHYWYEH